MNIRDLHRKLHIINYTDSHGRYLSQLGIDREVKPFGLDRLSSYLKKLRKKGEPVLVIENGDSLQGPPLVDLHDYSSPKCEELEHPLTIVQRELGVDCFIPGNHEFNFGLEHIRRIRLESQTPWLSANILKEETLEPYFQSSLLFPYPDLTVGILGVTTDFIPKWEHHAHILGLEFENILTSVGQHIGELRKQCDYLIVVYHGGLERNPKTGDRYPGSVNSENQGYALWQTFPEIDLLLLGHQHRLFAHRPPKGKGALILQPACFGQHWAHVTLEYGQNRIKTKYRMVKAVNYAPDPELKKALLPHLNYNQQILDTVLGTVPASFRISDAMEQVWTTKHPFIQWIQNLMCQMAGVEIAAISLLDFSLTGLPHQVRMKDILSNYFFHDTFCILRIQGKILRQALELTASFFSLQQCVGGRPKLCVNPVWSDTRVRSYNYDIWAGIEYSFDIRREVGSRVQSLRFKGRDIDDEETLEVVVTSYRAGGAFYEMFSMDQVIQEFPTKITDLMIQDLMEKGNLDVEPIKNFKILY
ncbi:MAG: hypothetical protein COB67_09000 [SAR324 cluster bacterium]|uniref:Bifunctional metallophosphatase/5'-nucleotidase n=1 Tax=SAR324 cluster bacterium TaxID=2024889 RepID=A0A2A4T134_9DELT|nr:MAG: hypothetical protein COB67_09000 [SAR324 cluster bacterium]